jgi:mutator protein MutT
MSLPISRITNLCYIINDKSEVLLVLKKRGFGQGKWNGPGGKVKSNELPIQAVVREIKEEVGLEIFDPLELGYIEFIWPKGLEDYNQRCFVYLVNKFLGEVKESEECLPKWFPINNLPYDQMWEDDKYWYPQALAGQPIKKRFYFDADNKIIKFEEIES